MKRLVLFLVLVLAVAATAYGVTRYPGARRTEDSWVWLRREFHLNDAQLARIRALHAAYQPICADHCSRIQAARDRIVRLEAEGRKGTPDYIAALDAVSVDGGPAPEPADGTTPADRLSQAEKIAAVRGAIAGLRDELRDIVILSEYGERSHAEIAQILSTSAKAIESRLYRARQRLRKALTGFFV